MRRIVLIALSMLAVVSSGRPFKEQLFLDCFSSGDLVTRTKHEKIITQDNIPELNEALRAPSVIEKDGTIRPVKMTFEGVEAISIK